jgi:acyl-CoA synthetase (AMP-forming)/AMP-acid ligase II
MVVAASKPGGDGPRVTPGPSTIVIDESNRPVAPGETGRIARGGHVPLGYYKDPEKSASIFVEVDGARYVVPGDYGRLEEDGTLTLLGRGNMCVNTGGEKVFPEEVEAALKSHPDVFDALVLGVPTTCSASGWRPSCSRAPGRTVDFAALDPMCAADRRLQGAALPCGRSSRSAARRAESRTTAGRATRRAARAGLAGRAHRLAAR